MRTRLPMLLFFLLSISCLLLTVLYSNIELEDPKRAAFLDADSRWVDSVMNQMRFSDKLAQMILLEVAVDSLDSLWYADKSAQASGYIFSQYDPNLHRPFQQHLQQQSRLPLLMGISGKSTQSPWIEIPRNLSLGAIQGEAIIQDLGKSTGKLVKDWGIHLYMVPSLASHYSTYNRFDFVENTQQISQAFQDERLLACPKQVGTYFPFERDSSKVDSLLWPARYWSRSGVSALEVDMASLNRTPWNSRRHQIIRRYLGAKTGYEGLLIAGVDTSLGRIQDQLLVMVKAGIDLILVPHDQKEAAYRELSALVDYGDLLEEELNAHVKRILLAKYWSGALRDQRIAHRKDSIPAWHMTSEQMDLDRRLCEASATLVNNSMKRLPLHSLQGRNVHLLSIGQSHDVMRERMQYYVSRSYSALDYEYGKALPAIPVREYTHYRPVILSLEGIKIDSVRDRKFLRSVQTLQEKTQVILLNMGPLDNLRYFTTFPSLFQNYRHDSIGQEVAVQALFGGIEAQGQLPKSLHLNLAYGQGAQSPKTRLSYQRPEAMGIPAEALVEIDSIVLSGIDAYAMPGAQVLVAKSGQVIFHKAYGYHTYQEKRPVQLTDLYDIASITKVAATTMAAMKLVDEKELDLNKPISKHFSQTRIQLDSMVRRDTLWLALSELDADSASASFFQKAVKRSSAISVRFDSLWEEDSVQIIRTAVMASQEVEAPVFKLSPAELLTHHSGLPKGLPILRYLKYKNAHTGKYDRYYAAVENEDHGIGVAANFYLRNDYWDSLWLATREIRPAPTKRYSYSDVNMVLMQQTIDSITEQPLDQYLYQNIYQPLGLQQLGYLARERVDLTRIIPTEYDARWRGQLLRGHVHDPTAALLGGVSGNAGLFSNANDLAILFQMLLNGGSYGGEQYLTKETIDNFTRVQEGHRGYGFDKPPADRSHYIIAPSVSPQTYGHTGFTGTCVWVDPEHDLVFVFLTNRVHPRSSNWKLNEMRIRQRVQEAVYAAME